MGQLLPASYQNSSVVYNQETDIFTPMLLHPTSYLTQVSSYARSNHFVSLNFDIANEELLADQLAELSKISLARIICDNTGINSIQRNIFLKPSSL